MRLIGDQCSLPRIRAEIGIPGGTPGWLGWLVATTADGTVVGAVAGGVPSSGSGEVYSLCTAPSHRRGKIGSALLSAATDQQKQHEARQQAISLHSPDDPLLPFLRHHGFRLQEPAPGRDDTLRCLRTL
ncbi:GNAT family N-acetyltransferase [Streptomyces sp. HNM0574]|uniref:GNAT family N-acetyltransferase n=1 Tax=Streptomyces sp. HNM0574 TaxID=2714954 RepID=UPI001F10C82F|nr:GNAT family N-acetyltransferase [Streptomyces sp. HNM0574]